MKAQLQAWGAGLALMLLVALIASTLIYRSMYITTDTALTAVNASIKAQNETSTKKLADLTAERDQKQAQLDQAAKDQEKTDASAKTEIARLDAELRNRPVLVRYVTASGKGGGSAASDPASSAKNSAGDAGTAIGVLPESNSRRLASALTEVETLSAAYNSCRAKVIPVSVALNEPLRQGSYQF